MEPPYAASRVRLPVERLHSATLGLDRVNEAMDALAAGEVTGAARDAPGTPRR